ncbi:hypothetical protein J7F01_14905 [Streptomyces sp. ISL-22]|uniref:hypothetical protein n=1 Tax=unclassified Streptomyces TaxID=2593676 RepID=UPI001BEB1C9C|nr:MULTISPECIES: hypothetical protein [unclassified Streptomyces]MBT2421912.1 hypothetical protein [Streptomyces sp. ISL-24]MBT2433462.1 hypothetical protein [Streptomyces sp. ISL-22]
MRKFLTVSGVASTAVAVGLLLATPAAAAKASSEFDVVFPGNKPHTAYYVDNTVDLNGANVMGKAMLHWGILVDQVVDNSKRFTSFKITTKLEQRLTRFGADRVVSSRTCDLTRLVNDHYDWFVDEPVNNCVASPTPYDRELWWSSDSTIVYDIEGDTKGPITQELQGTPLVHG